MIVAVLSVKTVSCVCSVQLDRWSAFASGALRSFVRGPFTSVAVGFGVPIGNVVGRRTAVNIPLPAASIAHFPFSSGGGWPPNC